MPASVSARQTIGSVGATLLNAIAPLGESATRMSGLSAINSCASGLSFSTSP
jgi:hypothetical protein